ncbi:MAG: hypothetical protein ABJE95_21105 [Byssovorax sp.]
MSLRLVLVVLAVLVVALRLLLARQKRAAALAAAAARGRRCPDCGARRVVAQKSLALPPDAEGKSLQLKAIACRACTFRGLAAHHGDAPPRGHRLDWQEHAAFTLAVDRCPAPADPACECPTHQRFGALSKATRDQLGFDLE